MDLKSPRDVNLNAGVRTPAKLKKNYICCMKNFRLLLLPVGIYALLFVFSCKREYPDRVCESSSNIPCGVDSNAINVRVINISGYPLCDFTVIWETNKGQQYKYGRLEDGEISCYTIVDAPKAFPYVTFNLGTGHYRIQDTLKTDTLPYNTTKIETPGLYSFEVYIADSLVTERCATRFYLDK